MMKTFKQKFDKDLKDYLKESMNINVTINWSIAIAVDNIKDDSLLLQEKMVANERSIVYIFVGKNSKREKAIDIGQTSKSLLERTKQHLQNGDYLEGYPKNQKVYCGKVSAGLTVDKELLEQVEGIIIRHLVGNKDYHLCNDSKRKTYKSRYKIGHIYNDNIPEELQNILPVYIPEND